MKLHEFFTNQSKWTQDAFAVRADGDCVDPDSRKAVAWCLLGAIDICYPDEAAGDRIASMLNEAVGMSIDSWNDAPKRTFDEVRGLLLQLDI